MDPKNQIHYDIADLLEKIAHLNIKMAGITKIHPVELDLMRSYLKEMDRLLAELPVMQLPKPTFGTPKEVPETTSLFGFSAPEEAPAATDVAPQTQIESAPVTEEVEPPLAETETPAMHEETVFEEPMPIAGEDETIPSTEEATAENEMPEDLGEPEGAQITEDEADEQGHTHYIGDTETEVPLEAFEDDNIFEPEIEEGIDVDAYSQPVDEVEEKGDVWGDVENEAALTEPEPYSQQVTEPATAGADDDPFAFNEPEQDMDLPAEEYQVETEDTLESEAAPAFESQEPEVPTEPIAEYQPEPEQPPVQPEPTASYSPPVPPTPPTTEEPPKRSLNDLFSREEKGDLAARFQFQNRKNIREMIDLSERYIFTKELFAGDADYYDRAIRQLNQFETYAEAEAFMINELSPKYAWAGKDNVVAQFTRIIQRRFA